ncbi:MAG: ferritin-like domain-containing protein [Myxococcaceae bacterium]
MTITVWRRSDAGDDALSLTREHELIAQPRRGEPIDWKSFDARSIDERWLGPARELWKHRAYTEFHSLTQFTQLASQVQALGAPLDWSGAFARMIADEVRHVDLCLQMHRALGGTADLELETLEHVHLRQRGSLRAHVRRVVVSSFCIGETLSGRMFKRCLAACTVPLAREVVTAILVDETFHAECGWELGALLMRPDEHLETERASLAAELPSLFREYAGVCHATRSPAWTRAQSEVEDGPRLGGLSSEGYARAFFDGMEEDVVPGLEAIGFPEARTAWDGFVASLPE